MRLFGELRVVILVLSWVIRARSRPLVPCLFIFGDSLVDNGNNNGILTLARANYMPYGIDFPSGVTGRFNNGQTTVDVLDAWTPFVFETTMNFTRNGYSDRNNTNSSIGPPLTWIMTKLVEIPAIPHIANRLDIRSASWWTQNLNIAKLLGFSDFIPPYVSARGRAILRGLNYASGASGIREETGTNLGDHMSMDRQVENFGRTVLQMRSFFGGSANRASEYLSKCIYLVGIGSNDYLNNYFMPYLYTTSMRYSPKTYASILIEEYSRQLTQLYDLGARKFAVSAVGQIGCIPYELARLNNGNGNSNGKGGRCNERINRAIVQFNSALRKMVDRFNGGKLPGTKFVYVDTYDSSRDLVAHASSYGFKVIDRGCCGVGRNNGQVTCLPLQEPCEDRSMYIFWDAFHPTEAANIILANKSYSSKSKFDVYPINIRQLAMA